MKVVLSSILLIGCVFVFWKAFRSTNFELRNVEWPDYPENAPFSLPEAVRIADIPLDRQRLVALDLDSIEKRLIAEPWVKSVLLERRLPDTLILHIKFRVPLALLEGRGGRLLYVEADGTAFQAPATPHTPSDLMLLQGVNEQDSKRIQELLSIALLFKKHLPRAEIGSLSWDPEKGFRALISVKRTKGAHFRSVIELGEQASDQSTEEGLPRVQQVLDYLSARSIVPKSVLLNDGKKIVVRAAQGS